MTVEVKLGHSPYVYGWAGEDLLIPDNLTLAFRSSELSLGTLIVTAVKTESDGEVKTVKARAREGDTVDLSDLTATVGVIDISVNLIVRSEVAKSWKLEPLIVKDLPSGIAVVPQVQALQEELNTLKAAVVELKALIDVQKM